MIAHKFSVTYNGIVKENITWKEKRHTNRK